MKITRFYLTEHPEIRFTNPNDPDMIESEMKKYGIAYRREDFTQQFDSKRQPKCRVVFSLVSSLYPE